MRFQLENKENGINAINSRHRLLNDRQFHTILAANRKCLEYELVGGGERLEAVGNMSQLPWDSDHNSTKFRLFSSFNNIFTK